MEQYGQIDGLFNNAAINPKVENSEDKHFSRMEYFPLDVWNQDVALELTYAFLCAKHHGYQIAQNPKGGSIINISSDLGLIAPDQRLYAIPGLSEMQQPVKPITYSVVKTGMIGLGPILGYLIGPIIMFVAMRCVKEMLKIAIPITLFEKYHLEFQYKD
jgi:NAD(P)-dependent dehydrogenase (short-subunit alcohol dehydrogenase family)